MSVHINDPKGINEMMDCISGDKYRKFLEAKYEKHNLAQEVKLDNPHLRPNEQLKLYYLLKKYKPLFDGMLGTWKNVKYDIELKSDAKPFHERPYCILKAYKK